MLTYTKPSGVKISEICTKINEDFNNQGVTDEELYKAIYIITVALARQRRTFYKWNNHDDIIDEFALYTASELLMRIRKHGQLKNILNYVSASLFPMFLHFVRDFGYNKQYFEPDKAVYHNSMLDIHTNSRSFYKVEFDLCLDRVCEMIKKSIKQSKLSEDDFYNVYTSCLLTLYKISRFSVNKFYRQVEIKKNAKELVQYAIDENLGKPTDLFDNFEVALFNLSEDYTDIIKILVRKALKSVAQELMQLSEYELYSDEIIQDLYKNDFEQGLNNEKEEE